MNAVRNLGHQPGLWSTVENALKLPMDMLSTSEKIGASFAQQLFVSLQEHIAGLETSHLTLPH